LTKGKRTATVRLIKVRLDSYFILTFLNLTMKTQLSNRLHSPVLATFHPQQSGDLQQPVRGATFACTISKHPELSSEQREAVRQMTSARDIEVLAGLAGTGKSAAVAAAKDVWDASGYRVRGAALSGIAAENLEKSSGVESRTLASWELSWKNGRDGVSNRDVFVIDEAGMVGSRQMARVLTKLHEVGAKAVLIGDAEQLQPIEAGAAFRAIAERIGYQELTAIRRQQAQWQREASRDFARGDAGVALASYQEHGLSDSPLPGTRQRLDWSATGPTSETLNRRRADSSSRTRESMYRS
jgi:ATP-dependent exoDNAse (exonuclease V) alpha subunit